MFTLITEAIFIYLIDGEVKCFIFIKIKFNIKITLNSGKVFSADNVEIQVPNEGINKNGTVGHEYTDLQSIVFKRIEN